MSAPVIPEADSVDIDEGPDESALMAAADSINASDAPVLTDDAPETDETTDSAPTDAEGAEAKAPEPAAPAFEPFAFNAFKQRYEVPGLKFDAKARAIVADDDRALERVKQMLSHGREWEARGRQELVQLRRENELIKTQPNPEVEQSKVFNAEFRRLMEEGADEDAAALVMAMRREWPLTQARALQAHAEKVYQHAQAANEPPAPDVEQVVSHASQEAAEFVRETLENEPWATPELVEQLTTWLNDRRNMNQWVARATRDLPDEGVRKGQYVALWDDARAMLDERTQPYRDAHAKFATQQTAAAEKIKTTQSIAATNAKTLALVKKPASPNAAPRAITPAPTPKRGTRDDVIAEAFGTWREMKRAR